MAELPKGFPEKLEKMYGPELASQIIVTFEVRVPSFRINPLKGERKEILKELSKGGFKLEQVPWYKDAYLLLEGTKRELTSSDCYKQSKIYIQSLASMIPPLVLNPLPGDTVLDLTAAPGSKTSQIAALMNKSGILIANDNSRSRFFKLKRNMESYVDFTVEDPYLTLRLEHGVKLGREYQNYFDKVLLDAPCSAEARFINGETSTFGYWKKIKVTENAKRQRQLLTAALNSLKVGGTLVYSTCTLSPEENESQISWLLKKYSEALSILPIDTQISDLSRLPPIISWGNSEFHPQVANTYRIFPDRNLESFFVAKIRKNYDIAI